MVIAFTRRTEAVWNCTL